MREAEGVGEGDGCGDEGGAEGGVLRGAVEEEEGSLQGCGAGVMEFVC